MPWPRPSSSFASAHLRPTESSTPSPPASSPATRSAPSAFSSACWPCWAFRRHSASSAAGGSTRPPCKSAGRWPLFSSSPPSWLSSPTSWPLRASGGGRPTHPARPHPLRHAVSRWSSRPSSSLLLPCCWLAAYGPAPCNCCTGGSYESLGSIDVLLPAPQSLALSHERRQLQWLRH